MGQTSSSSENAVLKLNFKTNEIRKKNTLSCENFALLISTAEICDEKNKIEALRQAQEWLEQSCCHDLPLLLFKSKKIMKSLIQIAQGKELNNNMFNLQQKQQIIQSKKNFQFKESQCIAIDILERIAEFGAYMSNKNEKNLFYDLFSKFDCLIHLKQLFISPLATENAVLSIALTFAFICRHKRIRKSRVKVFARILAYNLEEKIVVNDFFSMMQYVSAIFNIAQYLGNRKILHHQGISRLLVALLQCECPNVVLLALEALEVMASHQGLIKSYLVWNTILFITLNELTSSYFMSRCCCPYGECDMNSIIKPNLKIYQIEPMKEISIIDQSQKELIQIQSQSFFSQFISQTRNLFSGLLIFRRDLTQINEEIQNSIDQQRNIERLQSAILTDNQIGTPNLSFLSQPRHLTHKNKENDNSSQEKNQQINQNNSNYSQQLSSNQNDLALQVAEKCMIALSSIMEMNKGGIEKLIITPSLLTDISLLCLPQHTKQKCECKRCLLDQKLLDNDEQQPIQNPDGICDNEETKHNNINSQTYNRTSFRYHAVLSLFWIFTTCTITHLREAIIISREREKLLLNQRQIQIEEQKTIKQNMKFERRQDYSLLWNTQKHKEINNMDKTLDNDNDDNEQLQKYSPQQLDEEEEDEIDQFAQRVRQKTQIFTGTKNLWRKASDQYRKDRQNINRTLIYQKNEQQNQANPSLFKELQTDRYIVLNDLKCKHIRRSCHCSILDATLRVICSEEEESNVVKHWGLRSLQRLIVNIRRSGSYSYDNLNGLPSYSYQTCRMAINAAEMWGSWGIWGRDQLCNQAKISDSLQQSSSENTLQSETSQFSSSTSQSPQIEDNNNNSNSNYKQDSINNTFLSSQRFQQLFSNAVNAFNKSCEMYGIGPSGFSGRGFCEGYWGRSGYSKPIREMNPRNYNRNTYHEPKESCILYVLQYIIGCSEGQNVDKDLVNEDENANQNIENENEKKQKEQNEQNNSSSDDDNNNQQQSSFTEYFDPNGALLQNSEQNQINLIDTASYCNYIYRSLNKYCEMASFDCSQEHKMNKNEYVYNIDDYSHSNDNISLFTLPLHQSNKPISSQIQIKPQILVPPPPLIFLLSLDEEFNRRLISAEVFDYTFDVFEEEGTYEGLDILNFHSYNQVARNSVDIVYLIENMKQWRPYLFKDYTMLCRRCALHYWNINAQNDIKTQYQSSYIQTERDNMNIDHQDGVNNYNQQNENMVNNEDAASSSEYAEVTSQSEESDEISSQSDSNISDTFEE